MDRIPIMKLAVVPQNCGFLTLWVTLADLFLWWLENPLISPSELDYIF